MNHKRHIHLPANSPPHHCMVESTPKSQHIGKKTNRDRILFERKFFQKIFFQIKFYLYIFFCLCCVIQLEMTFRSGLMVVLPERKGRAVALFFRKEMKILWRGLAVQTKVMSHDKQWLIVTTWEGVKKHPQNAGGERKNEIFSLSSRTLLNSYGSFTSPASECKQLLTFAPIRDKGRLKITYLFFRRLSRRKKR